MIIEIDDEFVDAIIQNVLVRDYVNLKADLKNNKKNPSAMHPEDAVAYEEVVNGIEVLAKWYFVHGEFEKAVKKAKKK